MFTSGADSGPLCRQLVQERVVDRVADDHARLRGLLRACVQRAEDARIQRLLTALAEMIDEQSTMGMAEILDALGSSAPASGRGQNACSMHVATVPAAAWSAVPT